MVSFSLVMCLKDSDTDSDMNSLMTGFSLMLLLFIDYSYVSWLEMDVKIRMVSYLSMSCKGVGTFGGPKVRDIYMIADLT